MVRLPALARTVLDPWDTRPIRAEVVRRRAALLAALDDEIVVCDDSGDPPETAAADHVVSVAWLARQDDLDAAFAQLVGLMAPAGRLHLLEPTVGVDGVARAQRLAATVGLRRTGWRIDRDVPAAARRAGLVMTDLERFSMPVPSPVLRPWIEGTARVRPLAPTGGETS